MKVLIISPNLDEFDLITESSIQHKDLEVSFDVTGSFGQDSIWWIEKGPDALILQLPEDEVLQTYYFTKLHRDLPRSLPIIFVCGSISSALIRISAEFNKVRILKSPVTGHTLMKNLRELITQFGEGKIQFHPRYLTNELVSVFTSREKKEIEARLKNVSLGGLYFESSELHQHLVPGDVVQIKIILSQLKIYEFNVKVVWSKPSLPPGFIGFGAQFIGDDRDYFDMIKNL